MRYEYDAYVVRVVDGDTVDVEVDLGLRVFTKTRLRLRGINAPELRTAEGRASRDALAKLLPVSQPVFIRTHKDSTEKYGRWLADLWLVPVDGQSVNQLMVALGYAVEYDGRQLSVAGGTFRAMPHLTYQHADGSSCTPARVTGLPPRCIAHDQPVSWVGGPPVVVDPPAAPVRAERVCLECGQSS